MNTEFILLSEEFCNNIRTEIAFIESLSDMGLITINSDEERKYLPVEEVNTLMKMVRLHQDLDINTEGLHAVYLLQKKINTLFQEISMLKNRLRIYEQDFNPDNFL